MLCCTFSFADTNDIKNKIISSAEGFLNNNFEGTDFSIKSKEGTKPEIGILTLKPIIDNDESLTFFQGSFFTHDGDRETLNLGLGKRLFTQDDNFMIGVNGFFDYEDKKTKIWKFSLSLIRIVLQEI